MNASAQFWSPDALLAAFEAAAPPALREDDVGLALRADAAGAGLAARSARFVDGETADPIASLARMEAFYRGVGAPPCFQAARRRLGDAAPEGGFEAALAARGYQPTAPAVFMVAPSAPLAARPPAAPLDPSLRVLEILTPLARLDEIWEEGGVGSARRAAMGRALAAGAPGGVLAFRLASRLVGVGFWAMPEEGLAVLDAVTVKPAARRQGGAAALLRRAAADAGAMGARSMAIAVPNENTALQAFCAKLGFETVGGSVFWRSG